MNPMISVGGEKNSLRKLLLACGILSSLHYVAINIIVPLYYPGYGIASYTVSELSAIGAPTRLLWVSLCTLYSFLVMAFGWGILASAAYNRRLRIVAVLIGIYGFSGFFWPPMHQREVLAAGGGTMTDTMHLVFAGITVLLMIAAMGFGAAALGKRFRIYTIVTIINLLVFGILTSMDAPRVQANLPTPYAGIWERINIGVFLLWVIVLAGTLLSADSNKAQTGRENN